MENLTLNTIQEQINEILTTAKQDADNMQTQVDVSIKAQEAAATRFVEAQQAGDTKGYTEAAADQRAYKDIAQMYADKKKVLDTKPLIDETQYKGFIGQIIGELDDLNTRAKAEVEEHLKQISAIGSEIGEQINYGNELLHTIQHELFKDKAEMTTANGNKVYLLALEKQYKDYGLTMCIESMKNNAAHMFPEVK